MADLAFILAAATVASTAKTTAALIPVTPRTQPWPQTTAWPNPA